MMPDTNNWSIAAAGDVMIDREKPQSSFYLVKDALRNSELSFCQLETAYSEKGSQGSSGPRGAMRHDLRNYDAIPYAGFGVVSMASNHAMDWGSDALLDCMARLRRDGITCPGAGADIQEAREPAIVEKHGTRVAILSYCSVAPKGYYASAGKPGVAPMRAITHYEPLEEDQPGTPCEIFTYPAAEDLEALLTDIESARQHADVVLLSLHWGIHYFRALLADYQSVIAHAAIDAGADLILGHHPHMLKGIEVYKNRAILYSIGNFAFDSHPKAVDTIWYSRRRKVYQGLLKVPEKDAKSKYHFQPESRYSMIAKIAIENRRIRQVSFVPVVINGEAQPEPFSASAREGEQVVTYVRDISSEAGLNAEIKVSGDEAVITGVNGI
jgi:poly-gamma-glutamate synthesis protein (capsule biosynthesis protein)